MCWRWWGAEGGQISLVVGATRQDAAKQRGGGQIERQAEPWPPTRHTGVVHEGVMERVRDAMSCERANYKPQVALEAGHGKPHE